MSSLKLILWLDSMKTILQDYLSMYCFSVFVSKVLCLIDDLDKWFEDRFVLSIEYSKMKEFHLVVVLLLISLVESDRTKPRIAIVGAGVGGSSVAYHLSQEIPGASVTVFEKGRIGGRVTTLEVDGREYEVGGCIIHPANRLMLEHLDRCQLVKASGEETSSLSIIRNGEIVYQQDNSWLSSLKAVLRYGLWSLAKMEYFIGNLLSNFAEIYPKLNAGDAFSSVSDLLDGMSPVSRSGEVSHEMLELTRVSLKEKMKHLSMADLLIEEIGTVATKVNYGQFPGMHSFVGSVSLAGIQGGLWRVQGGNYKIPECLISKSGAKLIIAKVNTVEKLGGVYNLGYTTEKGTETAEFDIVVLALPLTQDTKSLEIVGVPGAKIFPGKYQRTLAYIVQGSLNYTGLGVTVDWAQTENFFFVDAAEPIASIGRLTPVDYNPYSDKDIATVYKIFSRLELSKSEIGKYFSSVISVDTLDWLAYPDYSTYPGLSSFQLEDDLYYLNNIEWAASAMEMSALSARNIVNIIKSRQSETVLKNPENTPQKSTSKVDPKAEL